jgi:multiple sugar transport system substrate-binding protein
LPRGAGKISRKRFIGGSAGALVLAGVSFGGLVSCAGGGEEQARAEGGSDEPVTIEYWHINTENFGGPTVRELVERFEEQNPNITVVERFQPDSYTGLLENLQTSLASGEPPDIAQIGYLYLDYTANNFPFVPTEELVAAYEDGDFFGGFPDNILDLGRVDGSQVGMPYAVSNIVTYYNADMLREAGLDPDAPPETWEEWEEASRTILEATGKPGIYLQILDDNWSTEAMIKANGGQLLECEGGEAARVAFDRPEAVEAIQYWADLIDEGLALNVLWEQGEQAFLSGEVATFITTIAKRGTLEEQASFDLRGTTFPTFGGREPELPTGGNNLFVFSQEEEKRRAAWEFIKFLESPEGLTTWTEGTGYLPTREGVAEDPQYLADFLEENPIQAIAVEQIPLAGRWQSFPGSEGLRANNVLFEGLQQALGGQDTAESALGRAAEQVEDLVAGEPCSS